MVSGASNSNAPLTFGGLASGLDTNKIIDSLVALRRRPISMATVRQASLQAKQGALKQVGSSFTSLIGTINGLATSTTYSARRATVLADTLNAGKLEASAATGTATGTFTVDIVGLATATKVTSTSAAGLAVVAASPMDKAGFLTTPTAGSFTINGTQFTIPTPTATNIVSATALGAAIDPTVALSGAGLDIPPVNGTFTINGVGIAFDAAADSLNTIISRINTSAAAVNATYNAADRKVTVTNTALGNDPLTLADTSGNFLQAMKILNGLGAKIGVETAGIDMISLNTVIANINGAAIGVTASVVNDADGRANLLRIDGGATPVLLGAGADTSNFLTATNLLASPAGTMRTSTRGIAGVAVTKNLVDARFATALTGGTGSFTVNGVTIAWNANVDSVTNVMTRINQSTAGVIATWDTSTDKMLLTSTKLGSSAISLAPGTGGFLTATRVLAASQTLGQNASYRIDGGALRYATSNVVTDAVSGMTLTFRDTTTASVKVEVSADTSAATTAVQSFVNQYNKTTALVRDLTKYVENGENGLLFGDNTLRRLDQTLRAQVISPVLGFSGTVRTLGDVGISFGAPGAAVGATNTLIFDAAKFQNALVSDGATVTSLLTSFKGTAALVAGGTGSVLSIAGTPTTPMKPGSYSIASTVGGALTVTFQPNDGSAALVSTGTITAGGTNTTVIPGVTLTAKPVLVAGTDTVSLTATQHGAALTLQSFVGSLTRAGGTFDIRDQEMQTTVIDMQKQIDLMQTRVAAYQQQLVKRYAQLEVTISRLQQQQQALTAVVNQLQGLQPRR